jgi:hypothetical protein
MSFEMDGRMRMLQGWLHDNNAEVAFHFDAAGDFLCGFNPFSEYTDGHILTGLCGRGASMATAIDDLLRNASGRRLVANAAGPERREVVFPVLMELYQRLME